MTTQAMYPLLRGYGAESGITLGDLESGDIKMKRVREGTMAENGVKEFTSPILYSVLP